ncbi:CD48 antigen-like isoform X3 [Ctenopharyngodon idella]|uniref:CD48 antigen-like isoform X3 n=1 Tax=Ctenopharyngodon idella TaxID=7959 RepID=UPI002230AEB3|nr:CD48 antigen-like isoform X3 [Ctenopharyngodon idella]XP_051728383.1 CD48 antigen-like isoform X3 [Ctenopharyngodon idella]
MAVHHLLVFLLTFQTGFSAEIPVFVQTGDSVQLDLQTQELPQFDDLSWRNDKLKNIVKYFHKDKEARPHSSYKDRVDFNNETFSLTLKNMQKTDSGLYTARTSGESEENIVTYRVSVIDAVEDPVLTVNSNWSSSDSCTVNFTCRAHDLMIHSSYQNNRCSPEEVTSHKIYTLILYCSEESIICNHSNPVSSKKDRIEIKQLCVNNKENITGDDETKPSLQSWPYILVAVCLFLAITIFLVFLYCKCKKGAQEADNTVYAQNEVQDQTQEETEDNRPNTTYCTVGQHKKPAAFVETDHTIYSVVCKQPKPPTVPSDEA